MKLRKALFPGSFDPITLGHIEIVKRGSKLFDKVVVAIGVNSKKKYFFSLEERLRMLRECFADIENVEVGSYNGLTVDFARENGIQFLLRGLRNASDLNYEQPIAIINAHMYPELETVYLASMPNTTHLSSSLVREVIKYKGVLEGLVPNSVIEAVKRMRMS